MSNTTNSLTTEGVEAVERFNRIVGEFQIKLPPATPTDLTATQGSPGVIKLEWKAGSPRHEDGFKIERRSPGATDFKKVAQVGPAASSEHKYEDTGLASGDYDYRVQAFNRRAHSAFVSESVTLNP